MKKLPVVILAAVISMSCFAQESQEKGLVASNVDSVGIDHPNGIIKNANPDVHIHLKRTPVSGSQNTFYGLLKKKGFTKVEGYNALKGDLAGCAATIFADTTLITGTVWRANAALDARMNWKSVRYDYDLFKKYLSAKYGEPLKCEEKFIGAYREGDNFELKALGLGKCSFRSFWDLQVGTITIYISKKGDGACLNIVYEDEAGRVLYEKERMSKFIEDL